MSDPVAATNVRQTPDFDFVFGSFENGDSSIPYFNIVMSFSDASQYLRLINEMPGASTIEWQLEELFQRDIDWKRVDSQIVPYLRDRQGPNFFNALTIALLPMKQGGIRNYSETGWAAPELRSEGRMKKTLSVGPIRIGYWSNWTSLSESAARIGQICWNYEQVAAVAIDGQHRLAAIKTLGSASSTSNLSVILVVLSDALGHRSRRPLVATLRQLFIDLNKHAKTVRRARQILLDDLEVTSVCVRALVGQRLSHGDAELHESPPRLPLSLIDWHSEQARFDEGPYLSTILGLDFAVTTLLNSKKPSHSDYGKLKQEIRNLESSLDIKLDRAKTRLDDAKKFQQAFSYDDSKGGELDQIRKAFIARWNEAIVKLLTQLTPYAHLVKVRGDNSTLEPEFENWFSLKSQIDDGPAATSRPQSMLSELLAELSRRPDNPLAQDDLENALDNVEFAKKGDYGLAFNVVFQRGLFIALARLRKMSDSEIAEDDEIDPDDVWADQPVEEVTDLEVDTTNVSRAELLVRTLNQLLGKCSTFYRSNNTFALKNGPASPDALFWVGSVVDPATGTIDFTQSASIRVADLLVMPVYIELYRRQFPGKDFQQFWEDSNSQSQGLLGKVKGAISRMTKGIGSNRSIAFRIINSSGRDAVDLDALTDVIRRRVQWLWEMME